MTEVEVEGARAPAVGFEVLVLGAGRAKRVALASGAMVTIGRDEGAGLRLDHPSVSRAHAALYASGGAWLEDLGSHNGTFVGGERLHPSVRRAVLAGEAIRVGPFTLVVQRSSEPAPPWEDGRFEGALGRGPWEWTRFAVTAVSDRLACWAALARAAGERGGFRAGAGFFDLLVPQGSSQAVVGAVAESLRQGAVVEGWATVRRPADGEEASALLKLLKARLRAAPAPAALVPQVDAVSQALQDRLDRLAPGRLPVLVLGETGAGKEVTVRELHRRSGRSGPLLALNCAAISPSLMESELFGYERGAFTGAERAKAGLVEAADGGTLLLDEVAELPAPLQAKLLRVIEQGEVTRVGAVRPRPVDVRFVAATNRDLKAEVRTRRFREDLYFRLAGATLEVPPLRRRPKDLLALAEAFAGGAHRLTPGAIAALRRHAWPGNVRELKHVIERAGLLSRGGPLEAEHLELEAGAGLQLDGSDGREGDGAAGLSEDDAAERAAVLAALGRAAGNQTQAAKSLGLSRSAFVKRLEKYQVPRPRK